MKQYLPILQQTSLFRGSSGQEILNMLGCLSVIVRKIPKGQTVLEFGSQTDYVGLVLSGSVSVIKEDFWGNRNILAKVLPGELFAEAYACVPNVPLGVDVIADAPSDIMFMNVRCILTTCTSACSFHTRLIQNFLASVAEKNLQINEKMTHMAQRTTREKLLSYLSAESIRQGTASFDIPFNRQQLADYLSVDRSAMSNALCKMRDEGLITFDRNHFTLLS